MSNQRRDYARNLLQSLQAKLAPDVGGSLHPIKLNGEERRYLLAVCEAALADKPDPLGCGRAVGGQSKRALLAEARRVHKRIVAGESIRAACEAVGRELHRDGSKSGAVEKNYKTHREALKASDRVYAAMNARAVPDCADIGAVLQSKARGKRSA